MPIWIFFYYLNIYYEKFRDPIYLPLVWTFPLANKENCSMPKLCLCKLSRQLDPKGNSDLSLWNCVAELLDTKFMFRVVNLSMLGFTSCFLSSFRLRRDSIVNEGLRASSQGWPVRTCICEAILLDKPSLSFSLLRMGFLTCAGRKFDNFQPPLLFNL